MLIHIEDYFEMDNNTEILPYEIISTESFREEKKKIFKIKTRMRNFTLKVVQVFPLKFYLLLEKSREF
jgi:hypothetical protein